MRDRRLTSAAAGVTVFSVYFVAGAAYIIWTKFTGVSPLFVTGVPLLLMLSYALLLGFARYLRLRDDQAGDNLYYLGFLYTLTSLGVSLWQFSTTEGSENIVTNFGVAISSTILGVALRVIFNQMRQDPAEIESTARLELAESARRVKQELDSTIFEFASFRRAMQQSLEETFHEIEKVLNDVTEKVSLEMQKFPERSIAPIEAASEKSKGVIERFSSDLTGQLGRSGLTLTAEEERLAQSAAKLRETLVSIEQGLRAMQSPEGIIEIQLQPFIRGFTKAINQQSAASAEQTDKLHAIIGEFDNAVRALGDQIRESAARQEDGRKAVQELHARTDQTAQDMQRVLREIERQVTAVLDKPRSPFTTLFGRGGG